MLKQIISVCIIFLTVQAQAQSFHIVKLDSARWRIEQRMPSRTNGGGGTVVYSDIVDSANAIKTFTTLIEARKKAIDENVLQQEYDALNAELKRVTGISYDDLLRADMIAGLTGAWTVTKGKDTVSVIINKALEVRGGTIRGSIRHIKGNDFELVGVFDKPYRATMTAPGKLAGNEVVMRKE